VNDRSSRDFRPWAGILGRRKPRCQKPGGGLIRGPALVRTLGLVLTEASAAGSRGCRLDSRVARERQHIAVSCDVITRAANQPAARS